MAIVPFACNYCRKKFFRNAKQINQNIKLHHKSFCSPQCLTKDRRRRITVICENPQCNKIFERRVKALSPHNFCSRSCGVSVNNVKFPKNPAIRKKCNVCSKSFISRAKYCSVRCKFKGQAIPEEVILEQIKNFHKQAGRIPLKREFTHTNAARKRFGSWNKAIIAAGFKPNPIMFSQKYFAQDGHKCDSLAEKIIDDWLYRKKIDHKRSISYPGNPSLTVDFIVADYWIEFFGLYGEHKRYDELRKEKIALAKQFNLKMIEVYPQQLFPKNKLNESFSLFAK